MEEKHPNDIAAESTEVRLELSIPNPLIAIQSALAVCGISVSPSHIESGIRGSLTNLLFDYKDLAVPRIALDCLRKQGFKVKPCRDLGNLQCATNRYLQNFAGGEAFWRGQVNRLNLIDQNLIVTKDRITYLTAKIYSEYLESVGTLPNFFTSAHRQALQTRINEVRDHLLIEVGDHTYDARFFLRFAKAFCGSKQEKDDCAKTRVWKWHGNLALEHPKGFFVGFAQRDPESSDEIISLQDLKTLL